MIHHGDLFDVLPTLDAESVDASVTDPPYGIGFMGREWDTFKPGEESKRIVANRQIDSDNPNLKGRTRGPASSPSAVEYDYTAKGLREFQAWTERWSLEVFRVLKPGAHLLVCGAPRSFHRMACGLEDAGFEVRDCLSWLFGQGFPKSLDVSKAIDRELGKPRAVAGVGEVVDRTALDMGGATGKAKNGLKADWIETAPNTDAAKLWIGWGTALKPAWEPIVVARKPFSGTVARNVLTHGTAALNIDACRIEAQGRPLRVGDYKTTADNVYEGRQDGSLMGGSKAAGETDLGRWPANVVIDEVAAEAIDEQSGFLHASGFVNPSEQPSGKYDANFLRGIQDGRKPFDYKDGGGGASRFYYCAKPSREERDFGTHHLTPRQRDESRKDGNSGGDNPRNRGLQPRGNFHPTVKPVELMRWLVRLVTPVDGVVLDPFLGSGTTAMACRYEHRRYIGIEREADYIRIAEARIAAVAPLFGEASA